MNQIDQLRQHLVKLLDWGSAHATFDAAVEGVPPELQGVQPEGVPYSLWQLLEHIRLAQRDILDFCRDPQYTAPSWPDDYWPTSPEPPTPDAWNESVDACRSDREEMKRMVADKETDLFAAIPHGDGQTYLREVLLVADHGAYHVGEMIAVRRMLGAWK
jgi:hypothetical protein